MNPQGVGELARQRGWQLEEEGKSNNSLVLRRGALRLEGHWGRFATLLPQARLVISMAGTATEQAVGLGIPVLQLAGHGPQFTAGFAEAQRRLLGPAVHCAAGAVDDPATLRASAQLLEQLLTLPEQELERYRQEGLQRLGSQGGTERMAQAILEALKQG